MSVAAERMPGGIVIEEGLQQPAPCVGPITLADLTEQFNDPTRVPSYLNVSPTVLRQLAEIIPEIADAAALRYGEINNPLVSLGVMQEVIIDLDDDSSARSKLSHEFPHSGDEWREGLASLELGERSMNGVRRRSRNTLRHLGPIMHEVSEDPKRGDHGYRHVR